MDLNGDGYLDAVMNTWGDSAIVYINDGCDLILSPQFFLGESSHGVTLGDYNKDGKIDAVCFGRDYPNTVHLNNLNKVTGTNSNACIVTFVANKEKAIGLTYDNVTNTLFAPEELSAVSISDTQGRVLKTANNVSELKFESTNSGIFIIRAISKSGESESLKIIK